MSLFNNLKKSNNPNDFFGKPVVKHIGSTNPKPKTNKKGSFFKKATKTIKTGLKYKEKYDRFIIKQNRLSAAKARAKASSRRAKQSLRSTRPKNAFNL